MRPNALYVQRHEAECIYFSLKLPEIFRNGAFSHILSQLLPYQFLQIENEAQSLGGGEILDSSDSYDLYLMCHRVGKAVFLLLQEVSCVSRIRLQNGSEPSL
jgi:hypothetical protein